MHYSAPSSLKWAYAIVVLSAVVPIGLGSSGWVSMAMGGSVITAVPLLGPVLFLLLGLYRTVLVVWKPETLDSYRVSGLASMFRKVGIGGIYFGAVVGALNLLSRPLTQALFSQRTESGVEFVVVGLYLALAGGVGVLGLLLFEFSRLLGFEAALREGELHPRFEPTQPGEIAASAG